MKIIVHEFHCARPGREVKENPDEVSIVPGLAWTSTTLEKNYEELGIGYCWDTAHPEGRVDCRHATYSNIQTKLLLRSKETPPGIHIIPTPWAGHKGFP